MKVKMIYTGTTKYIWNTGTPQKFLTSNKVYDCEYTPKMYDPQTFDVIIGLIVKCDDGHSRKCEVWEFMTLDEWRHEKISEILDPEKSVT